MLKFCNSGGKGGWIRIEKWHPQRDSNPCYQDENLVSWASRRWGLKAKKITASAVMDKAKWRPHGDSNPGYQDENLVS